MTTIKINSLINHMVIVVTDKNESIEEITQKVTSALLKAVDSCDKFKNSSSMLQSTLSSKEPGANMAKEKTGKSSVSQAVY